MSSLRETVERPYRVLFDDGDVYSLTRGEAEGCLLDEDDDEAAPVRGRVELVCTGLTAFDLGLGSCMRDVKGKHTRVLVLSAFLRAKDPIDKRERSEFPQ